MRYSYFPWQTFALNLNLSFNSLEHPSFRVLGAKPETIILSVRQRVAALALLIFGLAFALLGGPFFFYAYTRHLKERRIQQLLKSNCLARRLKCLQNPLTSLLKYLNSLLNPLKSLQVSLVSHLQIL